MVNAFNLPNRLRKDRRGNVAITFGLILTPVIVLAGGAYDFANALNAKRKIQNAADAAVLAAVAMPYGTSDGARSDLATSIFNSNIAGLSGVTPNTSVSGNSVSLTATASVPTAFLRVAHIDSFSVGGSATGSVTYTDTTSTSTTTTDSGKACLLALDPNATNGFKSQGTPNVQYPGCWAHTNSSSTAAVDGGGSASVTGAGTSAVGGVTSAAMGVYSPVPIGAQGVINDPFASVGAYVTPTSSYAPTFTPPTISNTCTANSLSLKKGNFTLTPGRYCGGINMQAQATVTFQPGVYVIDNGEFNVQSGASISGTNVLFYFSGANAHFTVIGGGTVNMKGRQTGNTYAGFLLIAHPDAWRGLTSNIQGGGTFNLEGIIYAPTQNMLITGNGDSNASSNYFGIVAKSFEFRGNGIFRYKKYDSASNIPDIMPSKTTTTTSSTTTQTVSKVTLQ